eukprot:gnl/TRDRNA2_/TRDRNA2_167064_c0_seq4.p1 gnl/TRDRNA2_/TRDRNA2_167064_c0~~gnl/TRDRNA2_/TRDRNA2_167064_c0_seq4.p1  ORF type:complete len:289 (+),score=25.87 gnl/TRDRNA2_/TRDRNA2_167064_c0_seq4:46-867(+)
MYGPPPHSLPSASADGFECRCLSGTMTPPSILQSPSLAWFYNEHMILGRPAILTDVIDNWPARSSRPWSDLDYLKSVAGHRTVPVEHGKHYLDDAFDERLTTLGEYIETHIKGPVPPRGEPRAYLAQHQIFEQCPKLRHDILIPDYCALSVEDNDIEQEDVHINAWFGPAGTLSPLHHDRYNNILAQVVGSKYVRLYSPEQAHRLYPHGSGHHTVSSKIIDPDDPDVAARFPLFVDAPYMDLILHEGECLYIPPHWWHFVESRETSFSVSFWW